MHLSWPAFVAVAVLAAIHLTAGMIVPVAERQRPHWLSLAGGITVAYVFVHILPDLGEKQLEWLEHRADRPFLWFEQQVYVGALLGMLLAYGLDHVSLKSETARFWVHLSSYALYNVLIGYYAAQLSRPLPALVATFALGAHFLVNDRAMLREGGDHYRRGGRLILAGSVVLGGLIGSFLHVSPPVLAAVFAVLVGGIILHAFNEEIPSERHGRFGYFALGAVAFAALILAVEAAKH